MRIAHFHTNTIMTSWTTFAIAETLRRMGHEVWDGAIPTDAGGRISHHLTPSQYEIAVAGMPRWGDLESCDVILLSAPEYFHAWLDHLYREERWLRLKATKVAFWGETSRREDHDYQYEKLCHWADIHYYPALEDVERLKGYHTTSYVDTAVFKPCALAASPGHHCDQDCRERQLRDKLYDAAFVGSLYAKRINFLNRLAPLLQDVDLRVASIAVRDLSGERKREWTELLVQNLRQIKIHICLPSNNTRSTVARPVETMACGSFVLTYRTPDTQFQDGVHCRFYDQDKPEEAAELIRYYLEHESEREAIAWAGCQEAHRTCSLETFLGSVLEVVRQ